MALLEELLEISEKIDLHRKDIRVIHNFYWEQTFCLKIWDELSVWYYRALL